MLRVGIKNLQLLSARVRPNLVKLSVRQLQRAHSTASTFRTKDDNALDFSLPLVVHVTTKKWFHLANSNRNNGFIDPKDLHKAIFAFTMRFFLEGLGKDLAQRSFIEAHLKNFSEINFLLNKYTEMSVEDCLGFLEAYTKQDGKISDFLHLLTQAEKWKSLIPAEDLIALGSIKDSARHLTAIMCKLNDGSRVLSKCASTTNFTFLLNNKDKLEAIYYTLFSICTPHKLTGYEIADHFEWIKAHAELLKKMRDYQAMLEVNPKNFHVSYLLQGTLGALAKHATLNSLPDVATNLLQLKNNENVRTKKFGGGYFREALFGAGLISVSLACAAGNTLALDQEKAKGPSVIR